MKYEIGKRIRAFRESTGMSQKEFAAKIGVSNARVSNWEKGINRPDADTLPAICEALNISPNDLLNTPSSNQLPADALEIAKAFSRLTPAGKELIRTAMAFAAKHHSADPVLNDNGALKRVGFVNGNIPLFEPRKKDSEENLQVMSASGAERREMKESEQAAEVPEL